MKKAILVSVAALAALTLASAAFAEVQLPQRGLVPPELFEKARLEAENAPPAAPSTFEITTQQMDGISGTTGESFSRRPDDPRILIADDNDGAHVMRGRSLVIHVFINHTGGTWSATDRDAAGAKANVAKNYYLTRAPSGANVSFDSPGGSYWFYTATVGYNIPSSGMTQAIGEDALANIGQGDGDGDGSRVDDFTAFLQNFDGGYENVCVIFEPKIDGRAQAFYGHSKAFLYTDSNGNVWAHEMGHLYGACDEYIEGGQCNGGIDCGLCQSWFLDENVNNGNCQLAACPSHVSCLMINNTFAAGAVCAYNLEHWGWVDEGNPFAGLLDYVKRRVSGATFANIYELYHNGFFSWNDVSQAEVISQRWNSWSVIGIRPPAGTDYDISLYGDEEHNHLLASSAYGGSTVDFVVGDYNHNPTQNEHIQLNLFAGPQNNYNLTFESGNEVLYPDGLDRAGSWQDYNNVRVWDVPLFAGEQITFSLDVQTAGLDLGMALYKSNGTIYYAGRAAAVASADGAGVGGDEFFTYTVPADDVYGLVVWSNNAVAGNFSIQIGPTPATLAEETPFYSGLDLRLFNYIPNSIYWAFVGTRPDAGNDMDLNLFTDVNYTNEVESSTFGGNTLDFVAVDYNHASLTQDYLRVWRFSGAGNHRTEWEQDPETGLGVINESPVSTLHLGKAWDMLLTGGETYFFREYHSFGPFTMDNGLYLFSSTDGDYYKPRALPAAASNFRPPGDGGEWFSFTAPVGDWYGMINMFNDETAQNYSIWSGPQLALTEDAAVTRSEEVIFGSNAVSSVYWTAFGARPSPGENAWVHLYGDPAYTISTLAVTDFGGGGSAVQYVVGDYNHNPLGTVYPRIRRSAGTGPVDVEWEGGTEQLGYIINGASVTTLAWPAGDVVETFDINVPGGRGMTIVVEDLSGVMDLGCELFDSNGAAYYAARGGGVAYADAHGVGGNEQLAFNNPTADWLGLVVFNKNDAGGNYRIRVVDQTQVAVEDGVVSFGLSAEHNPFAGSAGLRFSLQKEDETELAIFDLQGRKLQTLVQGRIGAGPHTATWDGRDDTGNSVGAGIYLARLQSGSQIRTVKLVRRT